MSEGPDTVIDGKVARDYDRRHIVARVGRCGGVMHKGASFPIYKYLTFKMPDGAVFAAEFTGKTAPVDKAGFLRTEALQEGDIIVRPGLLYRKMLTMPGMVMLEHLDAMKTWRMPSPLLRPYVDAEDAGVDMGVVDLRTRH